VATGAGRPISEQVAFSFAAAEPEITRAPRPRSVKLRITPPSGGTLFSVEGASETLGAISLYERLGWIYGAVSRVAMDIAGLPRVVRRGPDPRDDEIEDHPALAILNDPNWCMSGDELMECIVTYLELAGGAYLLNGIGLPKPRLWPLRPDRVQPVILANGELKGWEYRSYEETVALAPEMVIPITYFSPREPIGGRLSPLAPVRVAAQSMIAAMTWNSRFFDRGAAPGGILTTDQTINENEFQRLEQDVADNWTGTENAFGTLILDRGLKWQAIEGAHKDMGFEGLMRMTREEVLGALGVPPAIVGDFKQANYAQVEMQLKTYWIHKLQPIIRRLGTTLTRFIVRPFDPSGKQRLSFDTANIKVLQEDLNARAQREEIWVRTGLRTRAELREELGLPPYPGAEEPLLSTSYVPALTKQERDEHTQQQIAAKAAASVPVPPADAAANRGTVPATTRAAKVVGRSRILLRRYESSLMRAENRLLVVWNDLLYRVEREVVANVRKRPPLPPARAAEDTEEPLVPLSISLPAPIESYLPEQVKLVAQAKDLHAQVFRNLIAEFGADALNEVASGLAFDYGHSRVLSMVQRDRERIEAVVLRLLDDIRDELNAGLEAGETLKQMTDRIRQAVAASAETPERGGPYVRAERIARTEAEAAAGFARYEAFTQIGVERHRWVNAADNFVRESHKDEAEGGVGGEVRDVGEPFSNGLYYPGDPSGAPGEVINCRCLAEPMVEG